MMTILWQDGFDLYNVVADLDIAYFSASRGSFSTTAGRFGGGAWTASYGISRTVAASADLWSSFAMNTTSTGAADRYMGVFGSTAGYEVSITYNPGTGAWKAWRGAQSALLGTATYFMPVNAWHWVDLRAKISTTVGEVEIWVDETQVMALTGLNTVANSGQTQFTTAQIGDNASGQGVAMLVDDWFIYTPGTRLGDSRIETLVPTSDASPNQATPSTGSNHYAVVDEAQFNTTDYLTMANTSGNKEVFGHGSLVSTPATVHSVAIKMVSQKSDAGAFSLEPLVIASGTEGDGSSQALSTTWSLQASIFETNPNTSAAWAYAAVNSSSIGYKVP